MEKFKALSQLLESVDVVTSSDNLIKKRLRGVREKGDCWQDECLQTLRRDHSHSQTCQSVADIKQKYRSFHPQTAKNTVNHGKLSIKVVIILIKKNAESQLGYEKNFVLSMNDRWKTILLLSNTTANIFEPSVNATFSFRKYSFLHWHKRTKTADFIDPSIYLTLLISTQQWTLQNTKLNKCQ